MRRALLAVPLLALPIVLAFAKGGYFDEARLWAGAAAWALVIVVALTDRAPLPAGTPGRLATGGLAALDLPVTVVASRDEADPEHPYATGERYAEAIPGARLVSEEPGKSPLAWQGGQLSRVIAEVVERG